MADLQVNSEVAKGTITGFFNPVIWEQMKGMAQTFKESNAIPSTDNAATIVVKIQAGYEMGLKPIESLKSFYIVNGVLSIYGAAIVRRLREHGWSVKYIDEDNKCTATVKKGEEEFTDTLTFEDAEKSKWTKDKNGYLKPGWYEGANRKMKLRYGIISMILKTYIPEVLGSASEIAEIAEDTTPLYKKDAIDQTPEVDDVRQKPITDELKNALTKQGIEITENMTIGEASDLLVQGMKGSNDDVEKSK